MKTDVHLEGRYGHKQKQRQPQLDSLVQYVAATVAGLVDAPCHHRQHGQHGQHHDVDHQRRPCAKKTVDPGVVRQEATSRTARSPLLHAPWDAPIVVPCRHSAHPVRGKNPLPRTPAPGEEH